MKNFLFLLTTLSFIIFQNVDARPIRSLNREAAKELLLKKQIPLEVFEARGSVLMLGEVTGAGFVLRSQNLQAVIANGEVFLAQEISHIDLRPNSRDLRDLSTITIKESSFGLNEIQGILIRK
jgi:hypothetical protein